MKKRKKSKSDQNHWQGQADDAIRLAAFRWFVCTIEAEAIQIYATNPAKYEAIEDVLRVCVNRVRGLKKKFALGEDDCPPGYVTCKNECVPMCLEDPASDS